jgi:eukaryotic-like serine/threonine-protein kinase
MAHYSWLSPDRSSVLLVEMDPSQAWIRCRVAPMDGKSSGLQVGPEGACTAAAWSPDGRWMYLNVLVAGSSHIWRQRWWNHAPEGNPQQITFGPTEEEGLAVAADGKSLIASVGVRQSSIWTHDSSGDRMASQEGSASGPVLSADGKRLYYLLQKNNQSGLQDLWQRELDSGKSNPVLQGLRIVDYDISRDETQVAFAAIGVGGEREIFVAAADKGSPPRLVYQGGDEVTFGAGDQLIFRQLSAQADYLARVRTDGSGLERIQDLSINERSGDSPDGEWILTSGRGAKRGTFAISLKGRPGRQICESLCDGKWSADGKYLYLTPAGETRSRGRTYALPVAPGLGLPDLPVIGQGAPTGALSIPQAEVAPGMNPETYACAKSAFQGNLFRIPLH